AGVFEMRVRVHEAGENRGAVEVPFRAARADLDDPFALVADEALLDRRPVDGQHPVGRDFFQCCGSSGAEAVRSLRRSRSTDAQIDASYSTSSGIVSSVVVTGSTPGSATPTQQTTK